MLSHNAFRSPGAASLETLRKMPKKVDYFAELYGAQRFGIIPHPTHINESNLSLLQGMNFVFLSIDKPSAKAVIIPYLEQNNIQFIDCGMGVERGGGGLGGVLRITTSTPSKRDHVRGKNRIAMNGAADPDEYASNIQISEMNSLSADLAVIKWKKMMGFYLDLECEHNTLYTLDGNHVLNEDVA